MPVATVPTAPVEITVTDIRNDRGHLKVALCTEKEFLDDCTYTATVPARSGTVVVTIPNVAAGAYAAQIFQDENDNGKVDRGLFGIPKEGVGFSNKEHPLLGKPKFADALFAHEGVPQRIRVKLFYYLR